MPAGLIATMLGVIGVLAQTVAIAGYGWIIIRSPLQQQKAAQTIMDKSASQAE